MPEIIVTGEDVETIKEHVDRVLASHLGWGVEGVGCERQILAHDLHSYVTAPSMSAHLNSQELLEYAYTLATLDLIMACLAVKKQRAEMEQR